MKDNDFDPVIEALMEFTDTLHAVHKVTLEPDRITVEGSGAGMDALIYATKAQRLAYWDPGVHHVAIVLGVEVHIKTMKNPARVAS